MSNRTNRGAPSDSHSRGSRSGQTNTSSRGGGGQYGDLSVTAAVTASVPGSVKAPSMSSSSKSLSHSPTAAPRHALPQPRSSMAEGHRREPPITGAVNRPTSSHMLDDLEEQSSIRSGQSNQTRYRTALSTAVPAARNNTPSTDEGDSKSSGAPSNNVLNACAGKHAHSKRGDFLDDRLTNNTNNSNNSSSARRRTSAQGSGGGMRYGSGNNNNNSNVGKNVSTATALPTNHGVNTGSHHSDGGAASRHLQPSSNHSRVNFFVRDLPLDLKEDQLRAMFSPYGEIVNSAIMRNIHTGVSLGTAFVRFAQHSEAMRAMEAFAGGRVMAGSKRVTVQWARREHDKAPAGDERKRMRKLFIRNVPKDVTQDMLRELFSQFGPVKTVSTHRDTAAASAVSQPGGIAVPEVAEQTLDVTASANNLPWTTAANNPNSEDRRIAFVTFDVEGVAEQATVAIHNTMPFSSCNGIPLMVKLAEDTPVRHGNTNNSNNNTSFSAIGALGSATSAATMSAGNIGGHVFSVSRQPSNPNTTWCDFQSNEYLHTPTMSPPVVHLNTNTGAAAAAPTSTWHAVTSNNAPHSGFSFGSPERLGQQNSNSSTVTSSIVPVLSAPRSFNGAVVGNAPSPSTMSLTGVAPVSSNTTTTPYMVHSVGSSVLHQPSPCVHGIPAAAAPQNTHAAAGGPFGALPTEALGRSSPPKQQQPASLHTMSTINSGATGGQASVQDLCSTGYTVSDGDMYTFQPLTSASPEILGLMTGGMAMPSYESQDYYTLSALYGGRGVSGAHPAPLPPFAHAQEGGTHGASADLNLHHVSSLCASPSPALPSTATFSFFRSSPPLGHVMSQQPNLTSPLSANTAASSSSAPKQQSQQQANNNSSGSSSATVMPPAPRSVMVAAAAAVASSGTNHTQNSHQPGERTAAGGGIDKDGGKTLSLTHSDLAATHQRCAGRRAASLHSAGINGVSIGGSNAPFATSNIELASSFSSMGTGRYKPYEVTDIFGTGMRGGRQHSLSEPAGVNGHSMNAASTSTTSAGAAAAAGPGGLRTAPPTFPTSLPLPPSGAPTSIARQFFTQQPSAAVPGGAAPALPITAALSIAGSADTVVSLEHTLCPFDYGDFKDANEDVAARSQCTSSYAAEVLRAVTEGMGGSLGTSPTHPAPTTANTAAVPPSSTATLASEGGSCARRSSLTRLSDVFAHKDCSDGDSKTSGISSTTRAVDTRAGSSIKMSLTMGVAALLDEQMLYQWDGTAVSVPGASNSPSPAGAIGSQAPSPVAGSNRARKHSVLSTMPPSSTSIALDLPSPSTGASASASNIWVTADVSPCWRGTTQVKDPLALLPETATTPHTTNTTPAAVTGGVEGSTTHTQPVSPKASGDSCRRSTTRSQAGHALPLTMGNGDDDDEPIGWGGYPDLALNLSWEASANEEAPRKGHDGVAGFDPLYGQQMGEDAEQLYNFMTYDEYSHPKM